MEISIVVRKMCDGFLALCEEDTEPRQYIHRGVAPIQGQAATAWAAVDELLSEHNDQYGDFEQVSRRDVRAADEDTRGLLGL